MGAILVNIFVLATGGYQRDGFDGARTERGRVGEKAPGVQTAGGLQAGRPVR